MSFTTLTQEINMEIDKMIKEIKEIDNKDFIATHHKVEYKIKKIEEAIKNINYYDKRYFKHIKYKDVAEYKFQY